VNIIQIGCHNGQDHVQKFIEKNYEQINRAILIDANNECLEVCKKSYKAYSKIEFYNYAIVPGDVTTVNFYAPVQFEHSEHSSLSNEVFLRQGLEYKTIVTPAINLNTLLKTQNIKHVDRLYIDAEFLDIDIVNSIDFETYNILFLYFEKLHSDGWHNSCGPKHQSCLERLKNYNYITQEKEWDTIAIKI
jgi:hypothetical protein